MRRSIASFSCAVPFAIALMANGLFHWEILGWSVLACIPAIIGVLVGGWARVRLPWREFRIVSLGALAALGVALLFQAGQPTAAPDCNRSTRESCRTDR